MSKYDIESIVEAVLSYSERHNRKVTIAYLLMPGINDGPSDVKRLARWFKGKNVLINLLQYNETDCKIIRRPNKQQLVAFKRRLEENGLSVKMRESRGDNIKAACGQLVSRYNRQSDTVVRKTLKASKDLKGNKGMENTKNNKRQRQAHGKAVSTKKR